MTTSNQDSENKSRKAELLSLLTLEERLEAGEDAKSCFWRPAKFSQIELVEEEKFIAEYFGERAIKVKQKFHRLIKDFLERLIEKYNILHPHIVIASCDVPNGYFNPPNFVGTTSGSFLIGELERSAEGMASLAHEFGHYKLNAVYEGPLETPEEFTKLYDSAKSSGIGLSFKDSNFIGSELFGHPTESSGELYASAFMIAEMGFIPTYKELFFPTFTEEQKQLAKQIFEFVQRKEVA